MKVADEYLRETIDEYNSSQAHIAETNSSNTININGVSYIVLNMTYEEFLKETNGIDMEDIKWSIR